MNIGNKYLVTKFLRSFAIALAILIVITVGLGLILLSMNRSTDSITASPRPTPNGDGDGLVIDGDGLPSLDEHINFVLLATDDGPRTDTMLAGTFNTKTGRIDIISLPRDTQVIMPPERRQILANANRWVPSNGSMKLNEVHSFAGRQHGIEFATRQIEELLGIRMDFYARIDLEAFRFIVDSIGGVEFYVPIRMFYVDPTPGHELRIDLQRGLQLLDGAAAEGLVRYRNSFPDADLGRIRVQQDFIQALISQVVQQNMFTTIFTMMNVYLNYVDTNFGIMDIPRFLPLIGSISADNVFTHTLPGSDVRTTRSYFIMDELATRDLINEIFHGDHADDSDIVHVSSIGKNIEILNGAGIAGIAAAQQQRLQEQGFTVTSIGDFAGARRGYTRIVVRQRGHGSDLQELYEGSQIVVDTTLRRGIDVQIILGHNER